MKNKTIQTSIIIICLKLVINTMNYELNLAVIDNSRNSINIGLNASIINLAGILNNGADDIVNILGLTN